MDEENLKLLSAFLAGGGYYLFKTWIIDGVNKTPDEMAKNGGIKTKIKLSFRSQGDRPVNVFASEVFNGGGHANAAGGEYYGPLAEAVQLFLDNYQKYFTK